MVSPTPVKTLKAAFWINRRSLKEVFAIELYTVRDTVMYYTLYCIIYYYTLLYSIIP